MFQLCYQDREYKGIMLQMWWLCPSVCKQQQLLLRFTFLHALGFQTSLALAQANSACYYTLMVASKSAYFPAHCHSLHASLMHSTADLTDSQFKMLNIPILTPVQNVMQTAHSSEHLMLSLSGHLQSCYQHSSFSQLSL
jgi:hypothetical protein